MMTTRIDRLAIDRDADLVEALRRRHAGAAEQLVARYRDRGYRLALRIAGNRQDAEEALQDAFWNVIRRIDTFRGESSLGSWIYRITANAAYHKRRRDANRPDSISLDQVLPRYDEHGRYTDPIDDRSTKPDDLAMQSELQGILTAALGELPDHYRVVTVLHDVEGLAMAEVAGSLDITVATANSRAHRARLLLRRLLETFMSDASPVAVAL